MISLIFTRHAEEDLRAALHYFEERRPGLGLDFLLAVRKAALLIQKQPGIGGKKSPRLRRFLVKKYNYEIVYHVSEESVVIHVVAYSGRGPEFWAERLKASE